MEGGPVATQQSDQGDSAPPTPLRTERWVLWGHPIAVASAVVFFISTAFPVTTGLSKNLASFPKWWGLLDVGLAFVLAILALVIQRLARGHVNKRAEETSYRAYRLMIHGLLVFCVVYMLAGGRIVWVNCATGLAWRTWLLLYMLPEWFTLLGGNPTRLRRDAM
jgi:hypothetical protein